MRKKRLAKSGYAKRIKFPITKKMKRGLDQLRDSDFQVVAPSLSDLYKDAVCQECGVMGLHRCTSTKFDRIHAPEHYLRNRKIEPIEVIDDWRLGFYEGQVIKYLARWRYKGGVQDLEKAQWYLSRCIKKLRDSHIAMASHTPSCENPLGPV